MEVADAPDPSTRKAMAMVEKLGEMCRHPLAESRPSIKGLRRVVDNLLNPNHGNGSDKVRKSEIFAANAQGSENMVPSNMADEHGGKSKKPRSVAERKQAELEKRLRGELRPRVRRHLVGE